MGYKLLMYNFNNNGGNVNTLKDRTFGLEIECFLNTDGRRFVRNFMSQSEGERKDQKIKYNYRYGTWSNTMWTLGYDSTIANGGDNYSNAHELTSCPIKFSDLGKVKSVIDELNTVGAKVNKSCGLHVHIDATDLTVNQIKNVLIGYLIYEEVIAFTQPESRRWSSRWCNSSRAINPRELDLAFQCATTNDLIKKIKKAKSIKTLYQVYSGYNDRYTKVNLKGLVAYHDRYANPSEKTGTIEFRQSGGTTDWEKISNWISFCYMMVETSRFCNSGRCSQIYLPFARKKRMLFENLRFRLMRAFESKQDFLNHSINMRYQNARKFLIKRITHFTKETTNQNERNLINRTRWEGNNV